MPRTMVGRGWAYRGGIVRTARTPADAEAAAWLHAVECTPGIKLKREYAPGSKNEREFRWWMRKFGRVGLQIAAEEVGARVKWMKSVAEVKTALRDGAVVVYLLWNHAALRPDVHGVVHVDPLWNIHEAWVSHPMVCTSYDEQMKMFRLVNSRGVRWGQVGRCSISATDFAKVLVEAGQLV